MCVALSSFLPPVKLITHVLGQVRFRLPPHNLHQYFRHVLAFISMSPAHTHAKLSLDLTVTVRSKAAATSEARIHRGWFIGQYL